ncbi:sensor histidine kinase [Brevibacillus formosus]|uniref:histidine kinase n=1 Tax=Brevibacillus formosus TaxID=54913 RepID=A0A837KNK8_9BACL|nr:sensor histidine kinase [Brevibacillus formosus]KLH98763.1 histidine kinase [Brevibacillus formosus]MED1958050.1 sensor histidine kinase [Brevibacillus formosus]PSJ92733.1 GHKL domain-containing protein [Brevibacillus formosus]GED61352.1 sensor histidine kinase [Brevibacillus formosus]
MPMDDLAVYLDEHEATIVKEFKRRIAISDGDQYKGLIHLNGQALYRMVIEYFRSEITLEDIKELAYKVAYERNRAETNIGDFVSNVCMGREMVIDLLQKGPFTPATLMPALLKINECFDVFLVHAVLKYTNLKDNDLEEKKLFIERSHKDRLTILGQMASSFVHEFRNPLTSIMGFSRLLKEDYPNLPYVEIIENELRQLNYRVSQFLLVSKKGAVYKQMEVFSVWELFDEILSFLYPNIVDVNVDIKCSIDPTFQLKGYKDEMKQVFINIISNALDALHKKTGDKEIVIEVSQTPDSSLITVSNNGSPIPPDLLSVIFEPFFTTKELGTGIGLYVCKEIIERHGGTITCESTDQQTKFSMQFKPCDICTSGSMSMSHHI